jgi:hypothetical protein
MRIGVRKLVASLLLTVGAAVCPTLRARDATDPHWLLEYRGVDSTGTNNANQLMWDKRFNPFIDHYLPQKPNLGGKFGKPENMGLVASEHFGLSGTIHSDSDRYYSADGCMAHVCQEKGLLWVDLDSASPTVVFAVISVRNDPDIRGCKLYLFTSQELSETDLPADLRNTINRWTAKSPSDRKAFDKISRAVIVGPDGYEETADIEALGVSKEAQEKSENQ